MNDQTFFYYRLQRNCGKVKFLHLSAFLFIGVSGRHPLGRHPLGRRPLQQMVHILLECILVFLILVDTSFCGATDTPVSDFWWYFLWISKPEWAALFTLSGGAHDVCSLRVTSGATPADLLVPSMAAQPFSSTYLVTGIGGARDWDLSSGASQCDTKQTLYRDSYVGSAEFTRLHYSGGSLKARSHGANFFLNATAIIYRIQWAVWMSMILFRWCDCDVFLCAMSHMNRFHTHSVWLWGAIPNYIHVSTNCNCTIWTISQMLTSLLFTNRKMFW